MKVSDRWMPVLAATVGIIGGLGGALVGGCVANHLTRKGRDLHVALVGLRQWGDAHCSEEPPLLARTKSDKKPVIAALIPKRSDHLCLDEVEFVPGPGR